MELTYKQGSDFGSWFTMRKQTDISSYYTSPLPESCPI